ncbi:sugar phosphate isomerase/epimerase family protein [Plantactinospora endophytica]|uniref:sugar phosphate isomerase/epimerase family protein n=1 Tax=Plantactinospora endophytica TaxID=673535 RepID=UPI0019441934|nr:sugar phosphate isomerase/epimerase [Plantactinospora endophytica]
MTGPSSLNSLSLQLYSVRNALDEDLAGTLARVAEIGYQQVECSYKLFSRGPEVASALRDSGLSVATFTSSLVDTDHEAIFAAAVSLGATAVIDTYIPEEFWTSEEDVDRIAGHLNRAAVGAAAHGLRVGYHNHWWELERQFAGKSALELLVDKVRPEVVLEIDAYWVAVGGADPVAVVRNFGDRVRFLHLKDGPISRDNLEQRPAGQGRLPIDAILAAAPQVEVGAVEFDEYDGDIFEGIAASHAFLSQRLPGAAV